MPETYKVLDYIKYKEYYSILLHTACVLVSLTHHQKFEIVGRMFFCENPSTSLQSSLPISFPRASCFLVDDSISNFFNVDCDCVIFLFKINTSAIDIAEINAAVTKYQVIGYW